jgi:hypothetical protein
MEKQCASCQQIKNLSEFKFRKDTGKHRNSCKSCDTIKNREWKHKNNYDQLQYEKHKDKKLKAAKAYRQQDDYKKKAKVWRDNSRSKQRATNPAYRITHNLRRRTLLALHGHYKADTTIRLIGCSAEELKKHLESLWQEGMSWDNYGLHGWHIDHVIPLSSFDLSKEEEQRKALHYTNLQPLWAEDNLKKSNKQNT